MRFSRVQPNEHFRLLRLQSENGKWELGLNPYTHGIRLRMGATGRPPKVLDFCAGTRPVLAFEILVAIIQKLSSQTEKITAVQINELFPWKQNRPNMTVHLDPLLGREPVELTGHT